MKDFPRTIHFLHDDCVAEFENEIVGAKVKERLANYRYTKAGVNKDKLFTLFLAQIQRLLDDKSIKLNTDEPNY
jgi:hypothetical protein